MTSRFKLLRIRLQNRIHIHILLFALFLCVGLVAPQSTVANDAPILPFCGFSKYIEGTRSNRNINDLRSKIDQTFIQRGIFLDPDKDIHFSSLKETLFVGVNVSAHHASDIHIMHEIARLFDSKEKPDQRILRRKTRAQIEQGNDRQTDKPSFFRDAFYSAVSASILTGVTYLSGALNSGLASVPFIVWCSIYTCFHAQLHFRLFGQSHETNDTSPHEALIQLLDSDPHRTIIQILSHNFNNLHPVPWPNLVVYFFYTYSDFEKQDRVEQLRDLTSTRQ